MILPRITKVIKIDGYKIFCEWNTGEIRSVDFNNFLTDKQKLFAKIKSPDIFKSVKVDQITKTLYWDGLVTMIDYDGISKPAAFDFCPDTLYEASEKVN